MRIFLLNTFNWHSGTIFGFLLSFLILFTFSSNSYSQCSNTAGYFQNFDGGSQNATFNTAGISCWIAIGPGANDLRLENASDSDMPTPLPSSPGAVEFNDGNWPGDSSILVSPRFTDLPSGLNRVRMQVAFESTPTNGSIYIGVLTDSSSSATFLILDTIDVNDIGGVTDVWGTYTFNFDNTSAIGSAEFIGMAHSQGFSECFVDDFRYEAIPSCLAPTNLSTGSITSTSAVGTWTSNGPGTSFQVELGLAGFVQGTGTIVSTSTNSVNATSLTASTAYDWYVREICAAGDTSFWSGPSSFTTLCNAFTAPYSQNFDGTSEPVVDVCWITHNNTTSTSSFVGTENFENFSAPNSLELYNGTTTPGDLMAVSPEFSDFDNTKRIRFQMWDDDGTSDLIIGTLSDPNDPATFTAFDTILAANIPDDAWTPVIVSFASYSGTDNHFAFQHGMNNSFDNIYIDDVVYENIPSCIAPSSLNTVNIMPTSATGVWVSNGPSTSFQVELGLAGFAQGTGTIVSATSAMVNATSLLPSTSYDWYVREICAPGDTSVWSGPASFTTPCTPTTSPYIENFDGGSWLSGSGFGNTGDMIDSCWSRNSVSTYFWGTRTGTTGSGGTGPSTDISGTGNYVFTESSNGSTGDSAFLVSPIIDVSTLTTPQLEFGYHMHGGDMGSMIAQVWDNGSYVTVWSISGQQQAAISDPFIVEKIPLTSLTSNSIRIRFVGVKGSGFASDMAIDEVNIVEAPLCLDPTNLNTINIGTTTATGVWLSNNAGNSFEFEVGTPGFSIGNGTRISTTDTFYNATGLIGGASYDWYVREICGPGDTTAWVGPENFKLNCPVLSPVTLPFVEGWENTSGTVLGSAGVACGPTFDWSLVTSDPAGRARYGTDAEDVSTGLGAITLDRTPSGVVTANDLILTLDMSNNLSAALQLFFDARDHGEESHPNDSVWVRGSNSDPWVGVFDLFANTTTSFQTFGPFDLSAILTAAGQSPSSTFQVRFGQEDNFPAPSDGFSFDNIVVREKPANELELVSVDVPLSGCALGINETVSLTLINNGTAAQTGFPVTFQVDAQTPVTETVSSTLNAGDTLVYTFTVGADLSAFGPFTINAFHGLSTDTINSNDSLTLAGYNSPVVSSYPYIEDFEAGSGDWFSGGTSSSWQLGAPANTIINSAASGANAWVTNLTGDYNVNEASFVESPCFDLSSLVTPGTNLNIQRWTEFSWDGAALEMSTDAGQTWSLVGANGDPNNWYNDNTITGLGAFGYGEGWTGEEDSSWIAASHELVGAGGLSQVKLRVIFGSDGSGEFEGFGFDDFSIVETALSDDISVNSVDNLATGCGLSATTPIEATIINYGVNSQTGFDVSYTVNGGTPVTETVTATLNGGDTLSYTFTATADFSMPMTYDVEVYSSLSTDLDNSNDSASTSVESLVIPSLNVGDVTICSPQNVTLIAGATAGVVTWTDTSGAVVSTSDTLDLGLVTTSDTYFVEAVTGSQDTISTTFAGGNGQAGNMFDIVANDDIRIDSFDVHIGGTSVEQVAIYYRVGTYLGNETDINQWTFLDTATVTGAGIGLPTRVGIGGLNIPAGATYGMLIALTTSTNIDYTTLSAITTYSNADLDVIVGAGISFPLGSNFTPRGWNGRLYYSVPGCTSGQQQVNVNIGEAPNTSFTALQTAPLTLSFTQTITPTPDSVSWDYGDGNSSTANNPTHVYAAQGSYTVSLTSYLNGCDTTVTSNEFVSVSLSDNVLSNQVSLYPNPSNGVVVLKVTNATFKGIEVLDMLGNPVYKEDVTFDNEKVLELGHLASGSYLVKLIGEEGVAVKRLMLN